MDARKNARLESAEAVNKRQSTRRSPCGDQKIAQLYAPKRRFRKAFQNPRLGCTHVLEKCFEISIILPTSSFGTQWEHKFRDNLREHGLGTHIGPTMHQTF